MFDRFFSSGNVIWIAMGKVFDLFILNTLLLICCIPLFTIGPAVTAFFYVLIQMLRDEELSVVKDFFRSFRQNFRPGLRLGIPLTLAMVFFYADSALSKSMGTGIWTFFMVFFFVFFLILSVTALYAFPILAKFEKSTREILILAFTLSFKHLGTTILMIAAILVGYWITYRFPGLLFIIFGLEGMFIASRMVRILDPWLPARQTPEDDTFFHGEDGE